MCWEKQLKVEGSVKNQCGRQACPTGWGKCVKPRAAVVSGSTRNGSAPKLIHVVVGRIQSLVCCWIESLSFLLAAGWRPPFMPCHMGLSIGGLTSWQLASLEASE